MTSTNAGRTVQFGGGYKQIGTQGYQTRTRSFSIVYAGKDWSEVLTFVDNHTITPFIWEMPDGNLGLFRVVFDSIGYSPVSPNVMQVTCTFEEVFTNAT